MKNTQVFGKGKTFYSVLKVERINKRRRKREKQKGTIKIQWKK
jgi:hypothetical protein